MLMGSAAIAGASCSRQQVQKPNFIVIMTDDHTMQAMSCYGGVMQTPNLDRLAREGVRMDRCYVSNALSGPSRACILTGKLSHMNGFTDNSRTFDGDQQTFPKLLHGAGYQTAMIGKWHLNSAPQGFDYWSILKGQGEYYSPLFIEEDGEHVVPGYVTDVITDKAISFLEGRDRSKPFAMLYYHKAPHRNWMPAQRHLGMFEGHTFPEPETLLDDYSGRGSAAREQEMTIARHMWPAWDLKIMTPQELEQDYARLDDTGDANADDVKRANDISKSYSQFRDAYNRMTPEEKDAWNRTYAPRIAEYKAMEGKASPEEMVRWKYQQYMKDYCAVVHGVDENVGRLFEYLEAEGLMDDPVIIYTSDHPAGLCGRKDSQGYPGPLAAPGARRKHAPRLEGRGVLSLLRISFLAQRETPLRHTHGALQAHPLLQRRGRVGTLRPAGRHHGDAQRVRRSRICGCAQGYARTAQKDSETVPRRRPG